MSRQLTTRLSVRVALDQILEQDEEGTEVEPDRKMSQKWKTTPILIQTLRRLTSQQMERERHLKNRHLRRHSSPRVETCSGLHPPRTEEVEREWKTS
ncbi:homeodomain-interacting protein kinase 2-like protein [Lates japonicus]|uniref:Homeodomain-interacting protein kinase 2-like protein n=1 Tax=Lates japonicus TaxID=270547 RepID=A0AAD3MCR8_LATJO|nr:homeodomain-interacting protein kinase 2-like protein [Lates japonicus]